MATNVEDDASNYSEAEDTIELGDEEKLDDVIAWCLAQRKQNAELVSGNEEEMSLDIDNYEATNDKLRLAVGLLPEQIEKTQQLLLKYTNLQRLVETVPDVYSLQLQYDRYITYSIFTFANTATMATIHCNKLWIINNMATIMPLIDGKSFEEYIAQVQPTCSNGYALMSDNTSMHEMLTRKGISIPEDVWKARCGALEAHLLTEILIKYYPNGFIMRDISTHPELHTYKIL